MEEGWNGSRGFFRRYRQRQGTGSNVSSSRSGTIASRLSTTAYTSSGSPFSTFLMEAAMHFECESLGTNMDDWEEAGEEEAEQKETEEERIRNLVQEFFSAPPSVSRSTKRGRGDMSVVEKWLTEMRVGWVLSLDDASAGEDLGRSPWTWTQALDQVAQSTCLMMPLFPFTDGASVGLPSSSICEEQGEHAAAAEGCIPDQYHFLVFIQETMLKILTFFDVVVAWCPERIEFLPMDWFLYTKLFDLLVVHDALSQASNKMVRLFDSPTSLEVDRILNEMVILLSAYQTKASEATRSTMDKIRMRSMEDGDDSSTSPSPEGSSGIHKVTRSVMKYIRFLLRHCVLVDAAIPSTSSSIQNVLQPSDSIIMEVVSCLQEKLANIAQSISDQGLRFLFLLNNSYFIQESLSFYCLQQPLLNVDLNDQIEGHMERYLQVSWAPLLSCLINPTPLCLGKNYSPMSKFESEFQKIYNTQKQWKVPHPKLRRRLRGVITDKIIPGYTEYIQGNKVTNRKFSPKELKAMLQELFEG